MSGGSVAIRGYLVQTLVALLDALKSGHDWISVTLEPEHVSEKIDILWEYDGGTTAVQVKSSENQIGKSEAKKWAQELKEAHSEANKFELHLVGPCSQGVIDLGEVDGVEIPPPKNLDLDGFIEIAANRLASFMEERSMQSGTSLYREILANALVGKLKILSAKSQKLSRVALIDLLVNWINETSREVPVFPIFECPQKNNWFTGRENELKELSNRLQKSSEAGISQAISGLGGIGKTQLAIQYAYAHKDEYDAIFWVNAASDLDLQNSYLRIAERLRLRCGGNDAQSVLDAVRCWLENTKDRKWLLIFDNADEPDCLEKYLPRTTPAGHILITSRRTRLDEIGVGAPIKIEQLPLDDAKHFLFNRIDRREYSQGEQEAAKDLAEELDGLPLALEQAAAYIVANEVEIAAYLASFRTRKIELFRRERPVTGNYPKTVATTWLMNFEQVAEKSAASADVLRLSAMFDPDRIPFELLTAGAAKLGPSIAEAIRADDPLSVNELLRPLHTYSLIGIDAKDKSYDVHRLVQEVVKEELGDEGQITLAERAIKAINLAFPFPEICNWSRCERLVSHTIACMKWIEVFKIQSAEAGTLLNKAGLYQCDRSQYVVAELFYRHALEIRRQTLGEAHPDYAQVLNNLAGLFQTIGRFREAEPLFKQALEIERMARPGPYVALSLNNLAQLYKTMGRYEEAEPLFKQAIDIKRLTLGEGHPSYATSLNNLASLYCAQQRFEKALPIYERVVEIQRHALGAKHPRFALALNSLAVTYYFLGRTQDVETLCLQSIDILHKALGENHPDLAVSLCNFAYFYMSQGRYEEAKSLLLRAIEIQRNLFGENHPDFAWSQNNLAGCFIYQHNYKEAEPLLRHALDVMCKTLGKMHPTSITIQKNYEYVRCMLDSSWITPGLVSWQWRDD